MSAEARKGKTKPRGGSDARQSRSAVAIKPKVGVKKARRILSAEAEETLNAIRAGQIDALVIQGDDSDRLYAVRSFTEIQRTQDELKYAGVARRKSAGQLKAFAAERERLFQDMHDGCIQSIYAVGLSLEACLRLIETNPKKTSEMIARATVSLNLVIQELRCFITGHGKRLGPGENLRTEIERAILPAGAQGVAFTVDVDEDAMMALSPEQTAHLLQIAREGISNATRHANATSGHISLHNRKEGIRLEVVDDGSGFDVKGVNKLGLGLHHIKARARQIGGAARVTSAPNKGTRITVQLGKA
jgi:signal transduction histidine kinase